MTQDDGTPGPGSPGKQILVIGDRERFFLDAGPVDESLIDVCDDADTGIEAAANHPFALICIEIEGAGGRLGSILEAVREESKARVLLLARIWEEPIARRLVGRAGDGPRADDYVICPTTVQTLHKQIPVDSGPGMRSAAAGDGAGLENRIRVLERLATEDDLTGLKNRRYLWEFSRQILQQAHHQPLRMTLFVYDIDDFKHYNDSFGHTVGDTILKEIAVLMRRSCRSHDVVGRIGGDEFAVVFWDDPQDCVSTGQNDRRAAKAGHPTEAIFMAQRFKAALEKSEWRFLGPQGRGVLTISGGMASFPQDGTTIDQLFQKADAALLEAKRSGKNSIYVVGGPSGDGGQIG